MHPPAPAAAPPQAPACVRLQPQLFATVLEILRRPNIVDKSEMRRTTRMPVWSKISIYPVDGENLGTPLKVLARDISMEGIGLITGIARPRGDCFIAEFTREAHETSYLACRSVHCVELGTNLYSIGACFTGQVKPELFRQYAKPAAVAAPETKAAA